MPLGDALAMVLRSPQLAIPLSSWSEDQVPNWFVDGVIRQTGAWLIPCSHTLHPPAQEELASIDDCVKHRLPAPLIELLRLTNGAEFFRLRYRLTPESEAYTVPMYRILSAREILTTNRKMHNIFQAFANGDSTYDDRRLNYTAFCAVGDGNYLALAHESCATECVFFLDHEYEFFPFGVESTRAAYVVLASSFEEWLTELATTDGMSGSQFISL